MEAGAIKDWQVIKVEGEEDTTAQQSAEDFNKQKKDPKAKASKPEKAPDAGDTKQRAVRFRKELGNSEANTPGLQMHEQACLALSTFVFKLRIISPDVGTPDEVVSIDFSCLLWQADGKMTVSS